MAALNPPEDFNGKLELLRGTRTRKGVAEPGIEITLAPPDEPFVLLEQGSQPWMVVLPEEVRDHQIPRDAIADQTIG